MPVSKLIHAHRDDPNNQFIWGKLRCEIQPSSILLKHDEKTQLEIPEIEFSRYVLSWRLFNLLDTDFCLKALNEALEKGCPEIFNTDQGVQFTNGEFTQLLEDKGIAISMDGKGRALDNILVERLWRSVKYEEVYLKDYKSMQEAHEGLSSYFEYYNTKRPHQSLGNKKPYEVHFRL